MQHWSRTHAGLKRSNNEDAMLVDETIGLFGVADGMGGHAHGDVASAEAVRAVSECMREQCESIPRLRDPDDRAIRDHLSGALSDAVADANRAIHEMARDVPGARMGTTFCGGLVSEEQALIAHVGDSRAYMVREERLYQLTRDHTLIEEQMRRGILTEEEAAVSPFRHMLIKALGPEPIVEPDIVPVELKPGDRLLFCSDGVHGQLSWHEMVELMNEPDGQRCVDQLIECANRAGGVDNATAVLVHIDRLAACPTGRHLVDPQDKVHALWQLPLFRCLDYCELVKILSVTSTRSWRAGQVIFSEHDPGDEFMVVLDGGFSVMSGSQRLAEVVPGGYVGELALVDGGPRSASVVANRDSTALIIQREDFYNLVQREVGLASKLLWHFGAHMASMIRASNTRIRDNIPLRDGRYAHTEPI